MNTQKAQAQASRAAEARTTAGRATQRRQPGGGSYKSDLKAEEKLGAVSSRDKRMPEQLKGNKVRERA